MTYNEMMQKAGKQIHPKLYYYDETSAKIEINRDDIEKAKITFNAPLTGSVMLGLSATLKIKLPDKPIYFQNTVTYNGTNATKIYGPFYLKEEAKFNADSKTYEHVMYDGLLKMMVDYKPINIVYPTTVLDFLKQLCLECGYTTNITSIPNGSRVVSIDVYDNINYTYRDVLDDIANATGSLFRCNNGIIEKCPLGTTSITVDDDLLKNQNISLGEHFGPINSVVLSRSSESDNIYKRDETLTSWNEYKIVDNQLMNNNDRSDYLDELYDALYGIEYDIFDLELVGYGGFNPLDKIKIVTNNTSYHSYVLNNEIEFSQGVTECIYTEMPEESTTDYKAASTTDKKINQTWIIANKNTQEIKSLVSQVGDRSEKETTITQDIDSIEQKVSEIEDLTREVSGISQVELDNCAKGNLLSLRITGDIIQVFPQNNLYPSNSLFSNPNPTLQVIDKNNEIVNYLLPFSYLAKYDDEIFDEFYMNEDGETALIRRIGLDENGSKYILPKEQIVYYDEFMIGVNEGTNILRIPYYNSLLEIKYAVKSDYTDIFATKVEMKSTITQTKDEINLEVSKKVDNNEIISSINQSAEEISINANKISLEGITTINDGFSIDIEGNMIANNGEFTGGKITLYDDDSSGKTPKFEIKTSNQNRWVTVSPYKISLDRNDGPSGYSGAYFDIWAIDSFTSLMLRNKNISNKIELLLYNDLSGVSLDITSNNQQVFTISDQNTYIKNLTYQTISGSSLASKKKNFELLQESGIDIICKSDIYKFNFKDEEDKCKKHIGIVIGDEYNYSKLITNVENTNVDLYSMISVAWKAIQEQTEKIEQLKKEIKKLKESE